MLLFANTYVLSFSSKQIKSQINSAQLDISHPFAYDYSCKYDLRRTVKVLFIKFVHWHSPVQKQSDQRLRSNTDNMTHDIA